MSARSMLLAVLPLVFASTACQRTADDAATAEADEEGALREAIAAAPHDPHLHFELGDLLFGKGDLDGAIASFREMLANDPPLGERALAYDMLDMALTSKGDLKGAFEVRREELGYRPENAGALHGVAWYLATADEPEQRDPEEAVRLGRRMVELAPEGVHAWQVLGIALYRAGEWGESVAALTRSVELSSGGDAYDWVFLAMAEHRLGRTAAARTWLEKATAWRAEQATQGLAGGELHEDESGIAQWKRAVIVERNRLLGRLLDEADALLHGGAGE